MTIDGDPKPDQAKLPMVVEELTPEWLSAALSVRSPGLRVDDVEVVHVVWGTATKVLLKLHYGHRPEGGPPEQVCVKGAFDPALLELGMASAYQAEVDFYAELAPSLSIPSARCWYAAGNPTQQQGILILDDLAATGCEFGEPTKPFTTDQVAVGLEILAGLHAATAGADRVRYPWVPQNSPVRQVADVFFTAEYWDAHFGGPDGPPAPPELLDRKAVAAAFDTLWALEDAAPKAISHGDPHIGNTYLDQTGRPAFLDWQGVCAAPPMDDVAYLISGALSVEDRRAHERALLAHYRDAVVATGGPIGTADEIWTEYRREHLHGFLWSLTGPRMQPRERVFAMSERHIAAIEDHETLRLLGN
jgi:hypothetical protein